MASRDLSFEAIILWTKESPGGSRIATMLSPDQGLVEAFVFGGPKSKLRALATPYNGGRAFIHRDPIKGFDKLSDFDARETFPSIRESLDKLMAAGQIAEFIVKGQAGGGDYHQAFALALQAFRSLDARGGSEAAYPALSFIWKSLELMGLRPDPGECSSCGKALDTEGGRGASFVRHEGRFICPECLPDRGAPGSGELLAVGPGALKWLAALSASPLAEFPRVLLDAHGLSSLTGLVQDLAALALGSRMKSSCIGGPSCVVL